MRLQNTPVTYPKTVRPDNNTLVTSARAGKTYPAGFIPLLPEDTLGTTNIRFNVQMSETARVLSNAVHVRAHAYFVSYAALPRFKGSMDAVANSWAGVVDAPDLVEFEGFLPAQHEEFYEAVGLHHDVAQPLNTMYVESYNRIVNYRREQVSISLPKRTEKDHSIARALWGQTAISKLVPNFDAALEQGSIPLQILDAKMPLKAPVAYGLSGHHIPSTTVEPTQDGATLDWGTEIYTELGANGVSLTLASLEAAKRTQAFARLRETYAGNDDELIDLLMRGIRIPSAMYKDPILLGSGTGVFGIEQRYATDAANLDTFVTNGMANVSFNIRMPQQPTGGVVCITYEIVPEPVFDRMNDMFLPMTADEYPNALRDTLDPQKVDVVPNHYIDALHSDPLGTFAYAPMNYAWARQSVRLGGRYMRKAGVLPSDENQQNVWGVIKVDPVLNEDAFLMPADFSHHVFLDTQADPFKVICNWNAPITGITQFGPALYEASGDYDAVAAEIDDTFVDPSATPTP